MSPALGTFCHRVTMNCVSVTNRQRGYGGDPDGTQRTVLELKLAKPRENPWKCRLEPKQGLGRIFHLLV